MRTVWIIIGLWKCSKLSERQLIILINIFTEKRTGNYLISNSYGVLYKIVLWTNDKLNEIFDIIENLIS